MRSTVDAVERNLSSDARPHQKQQNLRRIGNDLRFMRVADCVV